MTGDPPPTGPAEHVGPAEHADPAQRFSDVFDVYFAEIHRYAAKRHGPDAAADVAAQAFLEAFRQRRRYDPHRASVRTWLYGIATKVIGRHQRAELRALRALARLSPDRDPSEHADQVDERVSAEGLPPTTRERAQARALIEPHRRTRLRLRWSLSAVAAVTAVGVAAAVAVTLTSGRVPPGATPPQKGNATAPQHPVNLGKSSSSIPATEPCWLKLSN